MDKGVHSFPSSKVNVIARLELELAYFEATVQHATHFATETTPKHANWFLQNKEKYSVEMMWQKNIKPFSHLKY